MHTNVHITTTSQCCGSGMFVPDPNLFHPWSEFIPSRIRIYSFPNPNFFHPGSASKNLSILTQNIVSNLSEIWPRVFVPDPDFFLPIPYPKVKKDPDPGSATLTTSYPNKLQIAPSLQAKSNSFSVPY